jgi:restriction endonuclease S subunit/very-short-patch-repair endonuclease
MVWGKATLGEVCRIEKGNIGILKATQGDYPLVVLGAERRTHNEYQFDGDAVVIPLVSSTGHGDRNMKRIHFQTGKFSVGSILCAVMPLDSSTLSAEFLYRFLDLNKEQELVSRMKGMANVSLSIKSIAEVEIPIPPIQIQQEIVNSFKYLETQTNSLSSEQALQLDLLKKLRQQILQDAVQGKLLNSSPPLEGEYSRLAGREGVKTTPAFDHPSLQGGELQEYKSISNLPFLKTFRRELRNHLTPAEATLWTLLSNRKLQGRKFRRQHSIGKYILDFFCPEERLAIELDGEGHIGSEAEDLDKERDIFLLHTGIKVLRFENRMVFDLPESVLKEIEENFGWYNKLSTQPPLSSPPREGEYPQGEGVNTTPASGHPSLQGGELLRQETGKELLERIRAEKQKLIVEGKLKKEKPLPPIKPEEIPFEIPENWKWCRLATITNFIDYRGKTPNKVSDGVKLITAKNVKFGYFSNEPEEFILESDYHKHMTRGIPRNGDILFTTEAPLGNACILDYPNKFALAQRIITIQPILLNNSFLLYSILSNVIQNQLIKKQSGATAKGIKSSRLVGTLIPLPPTSEQHRIVTKIEQLMKLCDDLEQAIQQNQKYTKELLQVALREALEPKEQD